MDGYEATTKILEVFNKNRQITGGQECTIVGLTSHTNQNVIDRCLKIGMKEVFHKPLKFDELKRLVFTYHYGLTRDQFDRYIVQEQNIKRVQVLKPNA